MKTEGIRSFKAIKGIKGLKGVKGIKGVKGVKGIKAVSVGKMSSGKMPRNARSVKGWWATSSPSKNSTAAMCLQGLAQSGHEQAIFTS